MKQDEEAKTGGKPKMPNEVFDAKAETSTLAPVPERTEGHILTNGSAANWRSITSESFLTGPKPGQEQVLIKAGNQTAKVSEGQRWEEVQKKLLLHVHDTGNEDGVYVFDQNRNTTVSKDDALTVVKNQKVTVNENQEVTVIKNQTVKVTGLLRKVEAKNIEEDAFHKIHIKAGTELILEGPGGQIIKIDSTGITIQGVMVRIN